MSKKKPRKPEVRADGVRVVKNPAGHAQLIGYARVSKTSQQLESQVARLVEAGCCRIYCEHVSGAARVRPAFNAMLETLRKGDSVVVVALDRLGRKMSELVSTMDMMREAGQHIRDLRSGVDTRGPHGRMFALFLATLAEAERDMCSERIREALAHSKADKGRPSVITPARISMATKLRNEGYSSRHIAHTLHVGPTTVRKMLELAEKENPRQPRLFAD